MSDQTYRIDNLLTATAAFFRSLVELDGICIITEEEADVEGVMARALSLIGGVDGNSKAGICVVVNSPTGTNRFPNAPGPQYDTGVDLSITENTTLNRAEGGSRITALQMAQIISRRGHHRHLPDVGVVLSAMGYTRNSRRDEWPALGYDVIFSTTLQL